MDLSELMGPEKFGIPSSGPASAVPTAQASMVTPSAAGAAAAKVLSPENPLMAFGVLAALTFGLMAFSTSVRVGGTSASLKIGD